MTPILSCICLTYGRPERLAESVESYLRQQCDAATELVIFNTCPQQRLSVETKNESVRVINCAERPKSLGHARNLAIGASRGDWLVTWDDDDLYLPHYLQGFVNGIKANPEAQWVWQNQQFYAEGGKLKKITAGTCNTFAFTRAAWEKAGYYGEEMNVGEDRSLVTRITAGSPGHHCTLEPCEAGFIYCWGNGVYHVSGQGDDRRQKLNAWKRAELALLARFKAGVAKPGDLMVRPGWKADYTAAARAFLGEKNVQPINSDGVAVVELGRYGDIINILPICKHLHEQGKDPHLIVAREFAPILDGVSYVKPVAIDVQFDQLNFAMEWARQRFKHVIRAQIYGKGHPQQTLCASFNQESWREAGFLDKFHDPAWKPVFDRRQPAEGEAICRKLFKTTKPKIITNLTAARTAPFPTGGMVLRELTRTFGNTHEVVDIGRLRLRRIYDLISVLESAALIVTIDTATLHLAAATDVPVVALINDTPWVGSTVRYNCAESIRYREAKPKAVAEAVARALGVGNFAAQKRATAAILTPLSAAPRPKLSGVTLWACVWSDDRNMQFRTLRVLRYCQTLFEFEEVLFLSFLPVPKHAWKMRVLQVPNIGIAGWNLFHNRMLPHLIRTPCALSIHEDGFPLDAALWRPDFLQYDFVGAPWANGHVGNAGFALESKRFMEAKTMLPFDELRGYPGLTNAKCGHHSVTYSDVFSNILHRPSLELAGLKIAPVEIAIQFSTEQTGRQWPSFGFHGRRDQPEKYALGWRKIEESEQV